MLVEILILQDTNLQSRLCVFQHTHLKNKNIYLSLLTADQIFSHVLGFHPF